MEIKCDNCGEPKQEGEKISVFSFAGKLCKINIRREFWKAWVTSRSCNVSLMDSFLFSCNSVKEKALNFDKYCGLNKNVKYNDSADRMYKYFKKCSEDRKRGGFP